MKPAYIGAPARRLYVCMHPAATPTTAAVLLCPPFGHEMARAHRLLRVLAERLARSGIAVLRFDPYGAGDSEGDESELDLPGWRADILTAHEHLVAWSGQRRVVWMGLGLGANACMLAAAAATPAPLRLLLCDPVLDGRGYLERLRQRHVAILDEELATSALSRARETGQRDAQAYRDEALGVALAPALRRAVAETDWLAALAALPVGATVLLDPARAAAPEPGIGQARCLSAAESVDWLSDLPEDGTLLPGKLAAQMTKELAHACA